jgi:putative glutamine amidotransferase
MARPRIALSLSLPDTDKHRRARARYIHVLEEAGAEIVPLVAGDAIPEDIDGACVSGGEDMQPAMYGETASALLGPTSAARDRLELDLIALARSRDLPILGICRGFQVLNVAFGGSLVQHVDGHQVDETLTVIPHTIRPAEGSLLAQVTSSGEQLVNSRHHQAVTRERLAPGLVPTVEIDGLVEAFEAPEHRWVVGVQWHPERTAEVDPAAARIFDAFVRAAERVPAR